MQPLCRLSRRQFLVLLASLSVGHRLLALVNDADGGAGTARAANSNIKASTTVLSPDALVAGGADDVRVVGPSVAGPSSGIGVAISEAVAAPFPFQAVAARWSANDGLAVFVRTSADGQDWTDWQLLSPEVGKDVLVRNYTASGIFFVPDDHLHSFAQCRLALAPDPSGQSLSVSAFDLTFIDATEGPRVSEPTTGRSTQSTMETAGISKPGVVSRTQWGCPEGQSSPGWPAEYYPVTHLVIHHTTNSNSTTDWAAAVRGIWYYHAKTLGWGDAGYNYMVDPNGVLYEGRAGGDDVIAGHTYTFNTGTLGIGFLGTYISTPPPQAALAAAERLIAWKCDQKSYRPTEVANIWHPCDGKQIAKDRVAGHRDFVGLVCSGYEDLNNTSCPGDALHGLLPAIRRDSSALLPVFTAQVSSASISPTLVRVGTTLTINVTVRNTGTQTFKNGSPDPGHVYEEGQVASAGATDTIRIGLDYEGRPQSQGAYPYRWGLGGDLAPGESRSISCSVKLNNESGPRKYWLGLVRESNRVLCDHLAETTVYARVKRVPGDAGIVNVKIAPTLVFTGGHLQITAEVENWSSQTLNTQDPAQGYAYLAGQQCSTGVYGAYRVGVEYQGRTSGIDHPYRWGVGTVPALSVRTFKGFIRMPSPVAARDFWVGFVQEGVNWWQDGLARTSVKVQDPKSRLQLPLVSR